MSFDDYAARHVKLKFGLATAIAVIKSKPESLTIEEYIQSLRNKLKTDDPMDVDFELSLGSDDFEIADEDNTEIRERDQVLTQTQPLTQESFESPTILRDFQPDDLLLGNADNRQFASCSIDEALKLFYVGETEVPNAMAVNICQNFPLSIGNSTQSMPDDTQLTCLDNSMQATKTTKNIRENIAKFIEGIEIVDNNQTTIDYNQVTIGNNEVTIGNNQVTIGNNQVTVGNNQVTVDNNKVTAGYTQVTVGNNQLTVGNNEVTVVDNAETHKETSHNTNGTKVTNISTKGNRQLHNITQEIDTEETQLYSMSDFTQNTHFSQSQTEDDRFAILGKYLTSVCKPNENIAAEINEGIPKERKDIGKQTISKDDNEFQYNTQVYTDLDLEIGYIQENKILKAVHGIETNARNGQQTIRSEKAMDIVENETRITEMKATSQENISDAPQNLQYPSRNDSEEELHNSQSENAIPFKIIEELNRVKSTFNKRNEGKLSADSFSTDSGYKSHSQTKSSYRSGLQCLGAWLNQSAYSLYEYLVTCPLAPNTAEITKEISQVLGDLVDRLHSEEKYPSFLDEVLGSVDAFLDHLSLGGSCGELAMTEKDESVHRILLLNTSVHIISSTIEKITPKLEQLHENITKQEEIYEIADIQGMENIVFIFHILEVLLQRYIKKKAQLSSKFSSQTMEEEKLPKRSSITDIWKQKWDPEFKVKESVSNSRPVVKCVDIKIGEVLNKLVVDCMDGYSLVSFAALQCFNMLQS